MFKLVISDDEGKTTVVPLVRDEVTIGRKEGNTIRLTERNVSRKHARLVRSNGHFVLEDLSSYNGVKLNGRKIDKEDPPPAIKAGDSFGIGDYVIKLQMEAVEAANAAAAAALASTASAETKLDNAAPVTDVPTALVVAPPPHAVPTTPARLVMLTPPAPGGEFSLTKPKARIGRAEDLDIWVNHRSISREHAEIVREDDHFVIVDLESQNGVRVNGKDQKRATLAPNDVVELGQVRFRFVAAGETYAFDADRTVQVDALQVEPASNKGPLLAAAAVLGLAVIVAAAILFTGRGDPPTITARPTTPTVATPTPTPPATPVPTPTTPTSVAAPAGNPVEDAATQCQIQYEAQQFDVAIENADRALASDPTHARALACKSSATEGRTYKQAGDAYSANDISRAYQLIASLPEASPFRQQAQAQQIARSYAEPHVEQAERSFRLNDFDRADSEASLVLGIGSLLPQSLAERAHAVQSDSAARRTAALRREQQRAAANQATASAQNTTRNNNPTQQPAQPNRNTGIIAAPSTNPNTNTQPANPPRQPSGGGGAWQACLSRGDNACVVRELRGRVSSSREHQTLIETYRAMGQDTAARAEMRSFVTRWPNDRAARRYGQILNAQTAP